MAQASSQRDKTAATNRAPASPRRRDALRRAAKAAYSDAPVALLESRVLLSTTTTTLPIINPNFGIFYKPGSTTVTASATSGMAGTADYTDGFGPNVTVGNGLTGGSSATVNYSDGTTGTKVDVPGWTGTAATFSPPSQFVGALISAPASGQPTGTSAGGAGNIIGNYPSGEQVTQTLDSSVSLKPNTIYTLSASSADNNFGGTGTPPALLLGLEAGGTMLTPTASTVPPVTGSGATALRNGQYSQTYTIGSTAPVGPVKVVIGVGPEAGGQSADIAFGGVTLTAAVNAPNVALSSPAITTAGGTSTTVSATYTSPTGINLSTITNSNLTVTGPGGTTLAVTNVAVTPSTGTPKSVTATYTVAAPSGAGFTAANNGLYTVALNANQVADTSGNFAAATTATFSVSVLSGTLAAGSPDPTFNGGNNLSLPFSTQSTAVQANGQILVAGLEGVPGSTTGATQGVLERLNADGTVDTTFGTAGIVTDAPVAPAAGNEAFYNVLPLSDGGALVSGTSGGSLLLARYTAAGTLDSTFGTAGRVTTALTGSTDATAYSVAQDLTGNIVVAGSSKGQFVVDRYTATGQADPTFNTANPGLPEVFGGSTGDVLGKIAVQADGKIVGVGASGGSVTVARLNTDGSVDSTFGTSGLVTLTQLAAPSTGTAPNLQPNHSEGLAIDSSGNILVANTTTTNQFATARLLPTGALDTTFGTGGIVTTSFGGIDDADFVDVQPDGKQILVGGTSVSGGVTSTAVAAYLPNGTLDPAFGNAGKQLVPISTAAATPTPTASVLPRPDATNTGSLYLQAIGSLQSGRLLVGTSSTGGATASSVLKRLVAPSPTPTVTPQPLPTGNLGATVTAHFPTTSLIGGGPARGTATVVVSNPSASTPFNNTVTVTLYVAQNKSLTGTGPSTQVGTTFQKTIKLKPHQRRAIRFNITSLPSVTKGTYYVIAQVVEAQTNTTTGVATPQQFSIAPAFKSVVVSNVVPQIRSVSPGGKATIALTIKNEGNQAVNQTAALGISASTGVPGATPTNLATPSLRVNLKVGQTRTVRVRFNLPPTLPTHGNYFLTADLTVGALGDTTPTDGIATSTTPIAFP